ncbi:MAG: PKD domain-containing protein [Flavobacteriales bacterium]|nr:PKD domain-containing protein [Flavobacteriales bacterium]
MKRTLLLLSIFSALTTFAQTNVSGLISSNTTWTMSGNPYIVQGNILVANGVTLQVEPGVEVRFDSGTELRVEGVLRADGTANDSIIFTSNSISPVTGDWYGITFMDSSQDFDSLSQSGCSIKYSRIEYAGDSDGAGVTTNSSSPFLSHCLFQQNDRAAIRIVGLFDSELRIFDCTIRSNYLGVSVSTPSISYNDANFRLFNSEITGNSHGGVSISWTPENTIQDNFIANNGSYGISLWSSTSTIDGNYLVGNDTAIVVNSYYTNPSHSYRITRNLISGGSSGIQFEDFAFTLPQFQIEENILVNNHGGVSLLGGGASNLVGNQIIDNSMSSHLINVFFVDPPSEFSFGRKNTIVRNTCTSLGESFSTEFTYYWVNSQPINVNAEFRQANIYDNTNVVGTHYDFTSDIDLIADSMFWKTQSLPQINDRILDFFDNNSLGVISYSPVLQNPNTSAPVTPISNVSKVELGNGNVKLCWSDNLETDLAGYRVYYGSPTGYSFSNSIDVGNVNTYTLSGVSINDSIAVTAYDTDADNFEDMFDGNESWFTYAEDASLAAGFTSSAIDLLVDFTNLTVNTDTVFWDFGDGNSSNDISPQHLYTDTGTYNVCLTVGNDCAGLQTVCELVSVSCPAPQSAYSFVINGLAVDFTDQSSNTDDWSWDFGDGFQANVQDPTHTFQSPNTYEVCLIAENDCGPDTTCQDITVSCSGSFEITASGDLEFCDGDSILLLAETGLTDYEWNTGATSHSIYALEAGSYYSSAMSGGCEFLSDTVSVSIIEPTPTILYNENDLTCPESFVSYQWYLNDTIILGATGQTYTATTSGNYTVEVVDDNGCVGTSFILEFTLQVGIWEYDDFTFSIYPNPATTNLTIESRTQLAQVWVRDVAGRPSIHHPPQADGTQDDRVVIDISGLPSGIYLVEVLTQNGQRSVQKVVVE